VTDGVLVLGGGVAGLSAAHELSRRGFQVTVCEGTGQLGGKARSVRVPKSGRAGRPDLPGEHGFRFFPGFYRHLPATMREIPYGAQPGGVFKNLRDATKTEVAQNSQALVTPNHPPRSLADLRMIERNARFLLGRMVAQDGSVPGPTDFAHFGRCLLQLLCSSDQRRRDEWEYLDWWDFSGASNRSVAFQNWLADGLTRTLVAARAQEMSTRTGGYILLQLLADSVSFTQQSDRVLCGPTSDVWIDPWRQALDGLGVNFLLNRRVTKFECDGHCVSGAIIEETSRDGAIVEGNSNPTRLKADWYVCAVPVEHARQLITPEMISIDHRLGYLDELTVRWMNGIQFYLHEDVRLAPGHLLCIGSPWAITGISQAQFWDKTDLRSMGSGKVSGVLSVDVSDWQQKPGITVDKPAMQCKPREIAHEVLVQLRYALGADADGLSDKNIDSWFIDPDVRFPDIQQRDTGQNDINLEPLLVNTAGSWDARPKAVTKIPNFFLASDYVRTYTDLATMEGANEAARRAVNGILEASDSRETPCQLWKLHDPMLFAPARALDQVLFKLQRNR
jgi:uncharacterized protein with NAD-binding domain and iron-sulfur cluster